MDEQDEPLSPEAIHAILQDAFDRVDKIRGRVGNVSTDTAHSIGLAEGMLSKAKALVGRDIDDERIARTSREQPT